MFVHFLLNLQRHMTQEISAVDRVMLLVDAFDLAKSSELDIDIYLDLIEYAMRKYVSSISQFFMIKLQMSTTEWSGQ